MRLKQEELIILKRKNRTRQQINALRAIRDMQELKVELPRSNRTSNPINLFADNKSVFC